MILAIVDGQVCFISNQTAEAANCFGLGLPMLIGCFWFVDADPLMHRSCHQRGIILTIILRSIWGF